MAGARGSAGGERCPLKSSDWSKYPSRSSAWYYMATALRIDHKLDAPDFSHDHVVVKFLTLSRNTSNEIRSRKASTLLAWGKNAGKTSLKRMRRSPRDPGFLLIGIPSPARRRSYPGLTTSGHGRRSTRPSKVGTCAAARKETTRCPTSLSPCCLFLCGYICCMR